MNGQRLKELRKQHGYSQEELGKKLNVVKQSVSGWENGKYEPDYNTFTKLAGVLETTVAYLRGEVDEPQQPAGAYFANRDYTFETSDEEQRFIIELRKLGDLQKIGAMKVLLSYTKLTDDYQDILVGKAAEMALKCKDEDTKRKDEE